MLPSKTLLSLLFISLSAVQASPLTRRTGKVTLDFATRTNERSALNIIEKDRARAQAMKHTSQLGKRSMSFGASNTALAYTAEVGVGSPATTYSLVVDTGSSITWVGASKAYTKTNTSKDTGNSVSVNYGIGSFSGEEWLDTVTLAPGLVISQQSIGVANSTNFTGGDGILGLGPVDLTYGAVSNTSTVPTVLDNLLCQGTISEEVLGIYYIPFSEPSSTGKLTFGGYDNSVITSPVNYVPLTTTSPATYFWGIDQSITYGSDTILSLTAGIIDTGTTLILIATDAFQTYRSKTGGIPDAATGLLRINSTQYSNLRSLTFNIGGESYDLTPNGQIWPRTLNTFVGGSSSSIYLIVGDIGSSSGSGYDFVNGYTFLERFYSVYDTTHGQVGFASTAYTNSTSN